MNYLIFLTYLFVFIGLFRIIPFFKNSNIPFSWLVGIFLFKILMGSIFLHHATSPTGDYTKFYKDTHYLVTTLSAQPKMLWAYILLPEFAWESSQITPYIQQCAISNAPTHNLFTFKLYLIQYLLTDGFRYAGVVIIALLQVIATTYLFKTFYTKNIGIPKIAFLGILLLPLNFNFFTNIFHKEGFIFLGLSICVYYSAQVLLKNTTQWLLFPAFLGLLLIYCIRPLSFYIYFPVWVGCVILGLFKHNKLATYLGFFAAMGALVILIDLALPSIDIWRMFNSYKTYYVQQDVDNLVAFPDWRRNFLLFLGVIPLGFLNGLCYPFFWDVFSAFTLIVSLENFAIFLLILVCIYYKKDQIQLNPILIFILLASVLKITSIGLLLEFPSAIMRYRAEIIPLFIIFLFVGILDYQKIVAQLSYFTNITRLLKSTNRTE